MERRSKADSSGDLDLDDYTFPVGTVVGFHALAGEVKVKPKTNSPDLLTDLSTVRVEYPNQPGGKPPAQSEPSVLEIVQCRLDRRMLLLKFKGYADRTSVEFLEGALLFTSRDELLPLDTEEFWVNDLVGLDAFTTDGQKIGTVCSIITGATDTLEIEPTSGPAGKTILVPFVKTFVPTVDMKKRKIEIQPIPGLLEPQ